MSQSNRITSFRLPLNFDRRADCTLLVRRTDRVDLPYRIWLEWANQREISRPLRAAVEPIDWRDEDVTYLIEKAVDWTGEPGALIAAGLEVGMFEVVSREGGLGLALVLRDFWDYNAELSPSYVPTANKGGATKSVRRIQREAEEAAGKALRLQPDLILPAGESHAEREASIALVLRCDRACGRGARRQFDDELLADALAVHRGSPPEVIEQVLVWVMGQRERPDIVTDTAAILRRWAWYREQAGAMTGDRHP